MFAELNISERNKKIHNARFLSCLIIYVNKICSIEFDNHKPWYLPLIIASKSGLFYKIIPQLIVLGYVFDLEVISNSFFKTFYVVLPILIFRNIRIEYDIPRLGFKILVLYLWLYFICDIWSISARVSKTTGGFMKSTLKILNNFTHLVTSSKLQYGQLCLITYINESSQSEVKPFPIFRILYFTWINSNVVYLLKIYYYAFRNNFEIFTIELPQMKSAMETFIKFTDFICLITFIISIIKILILDTRSKIAKRNLQAKSFTLINVVLCLFDILLETVDFMIELTHEHGLLYLARGCEYGESLKSQFRYYDYEAQYSTDKLEVIYCLFKIYAFIQMVIFCSFIQDFWISEEEKKVLNEFLKYQPSILLIYFCALIIYYLKARCLYPFEDIKL